MVDEKGVEETSDRDGDHQPPGEQPGDGVAGKGCRSPLLHKEPQQQAEPDDPDLYHDEEVLIVRMCRDRLADFLYTDGVRLRKPSGADTHLRMVLNDPDGMVKQLHSFGHPVIRSRLRRPLRDTGGDQVHPITK